MGLDKTAAGGRREQYIKFLINTPLPEQCEEFTFCIGRSCGEATYLFSLIHSGLVTQRKILHNEGYILLSVVKILIHCCWIKKSMYSEGSLMILYVVLCMDD